MFAVDVDLVDLDCVDVDLVDLDSVDIDLVDADSVDVDLLDVDLEALFLIRAGLLVFLAPLELLGDGVEAADGTFCKISKKLSKY